MPAQLDAVLRFPPGSSERNAPNPFHQEDCLTFKDLVRIDRSETSLPATLAGLPEAAVNDARRLDRAIYTPHHEQWHRSVPTPGARLECPLARESRTNSTSGAGETGAALSFPAVSRISVWAGAAAAGVFTGAARPTGFRAGRGPSGRSRAAGAATRSTPASAGRGCSRTCTAHRGRDPANRRGSTAAAGSCRRGSWGSSGVFSRARSAETCGPGGNRARGAARESTVIRGL